MGIQCCSDAPEYGKIGSMILCSEVLSDFRTWPLAVLLNVLSCLSVEERTRLQWCSLVQNEPTLTHEAFAGHSTHM